MYRWSFATNTILDAVDLQQPYSEAYTETAIGPDGTLYAINNRVLFALGTNKATGVSVHKGTGARGGLSNLWDLDGGAYSAKAVATSAGETVGVEVDFKLSGTKPTTLTISGSASTSAAANSSVLAYNYSTKAFENLGSINLTTSLANFNLAFGPNIQHYIGPGGAVRLVIQAIQNSKSPFTLSIDYLTCGLS
jgi:hypothetical protein